MNKINAVKLIKGLIIFCFIFICCFIFDSEKIVCNKLSDECIVRRVYYNKIIHKINYKDISDVTCDMRKQVRGANYYLTFHVTENNNGNNNNDLLNIKHYKTHIFNTDIECDYALRKFRQFQNSDENEITLYDYLDILLLCFSVVFLLLFLYLLNYENKKFLNK